MARVCAYCNSITNKLTREHIWPSCIIKRVPSYTRRYSERANKVFSGDLTISDVCAECNNGSLSTLDSYICKLYDRWFVQFPERGQWINFDYDWSLLGRWLLKISFNSARASSDDDVVLARYANLILGIDQRQPDLAIWLDLAGPSYFEKCLESGVIKVERIQPKMTRVCRVVIPDTEIPNYIIRLVAINAFYFFLAIPKVPYSGVFDDLNQIVEFFGPMACLDPEKTTARIETNLSTHSLIAPHMIQKKDLYDAHIERD